MTAASKRVAGLAAALLLSWCAGLAAFGGFGDAQGGGAGSSSSGGFAYAAHTADATLAVSTHATNVGASGEVIGTLPSGSIGDQIQVTVMAAQPFRIKAPTGVTIQVSYVHETTNIRLFVAAGTSQVTEAAPTSFADDDRVSAFASVPAQ